MRLALDPQAVEVDGSVRIALGAFDPIPQAVASYLRVELERPRGRTRPKRLVAAGVLGKQHRAARQLERVAVPLERLEAGGEPSEHGIVRRSRLEADFVPADLRARHPPNGSAKRLREQLSSEAHAEDRDAVGDQAPEEGVLVPEPPVVLVLVDVHGAPEHERRVELKGREPTLLCHVPLDELVTGFLNDVAEHSASAVGLVDHRKHAHEPSVRKTQPRSHVG